MSLNINKINIDKHYSVILELWGQELIHWLPGPAYYIHIHTS